MRFKYCHNDVEHAYECMVSKAYILYDIGKYESALNVITSAAELQYRYNRIFTDKRLDDLLAKVSKQLIQPIEMDLDEECVLFYDFLSIDNRGLTQQYVDSLIHFSRKKVVYVTQRSLKEPIAADLRRMLVEGNVSAYELENEGQVSRIMQFWNLLKLHRPKTVFLHIAPWSVVPIVTLFSYVGANIININLTDHAFWLGASLIDINIEFRKYGAALSESKRGLEKDKICLLPYYPWINETEFEGFPVDVEGKIVLFSGGTRYKISDKNNTFFHLIRRILGLNNNVLLFYAGEGNFDQLQSLIDQYNLNDRFILLGMRHDIAQVFNHCDIYIGSYPVAGGLMSQYAAYYGKPILALSTKKGSDIIVGKEETCYALDDVETIVQEALKMIEDSRYRERCGKQLKNSIISREEFTSIVVSLVNGQNKGLTYSLSDVVIDTDNVCEEYLERINLNASNGRVELFIVRSLGVSSLYKTPKMFANLVCLLPRLIWKKYVLRENSGVKL